mmetsp:Transcript_64796/g.171493  ORF Transcript_64796/g.171493 Transcript_64796/m.171493 type:complete len:241 (-) Transcript_64796:1811-2533(-)
MLADTLSASASAACSRSATSASICFTRTFSSASFTDCRSLVISPCMLFTRVCNFPSSVPEPVPAMASFFSSAVFWRSCFRATTIPLCADLSARFACSTVSLYASEIVSPAPPSASRACTASAIFLTSVSALETLASTSWSRKARFRSPVLDLNCWRRSRPSSRRFCSMSISSRTALAGPSVKRATSTSFLATKVCASAIAACTLPDVLSASAMIDSMSESLSPLRKGSSASAMRCNSSSA